MTTDPRLPLEKDLAISIELPRPTTVSEVEEHNQAVRRRSADRACYRQLCEPLRTARPFFAAHELRRRGLRLLVEAHGPVRDHLAGPLAMPEVPVHLYRLPRLSYSPISATPARPSCTLPAATWRTMGSPTVRRPARETE